MRLKRLADMVLELRTINMSWSVITAHALTNNDLDPVARRVDNFIQRINSYPADKIGAFLILIGQRASYINWIRIYPLDKVIHSLYNRALMEHEYFSF